MRERKTRTQLRLPVDLVQHIDELRGDLTRTEVVKETLRQLLYDMQHDMFPNAFLAMLRELTWTRTERQRIDMRLPTQYLEYLRLNQYNITQCIITALRLYRLP